MSKIRFNVTNPRQPLKFWARDADGLPVTDIAAATAGLQLFVYRQGLTEIEITPLSDKSSDDGNYAVGAIRHIEGGLYYVGPPDSVVETFAPEVGVRGVFTGGTISPWPTEMIGYDPSAVAVGANTVAPATPANVDDAKAAIIAAILNTVPLDPPTFTRSTADEKPIQFSWINSTDTLTATRSIDGGAFEAVAGAIAFFRNENSVAQYRLAYNAADRPTEEGAVRYKVTNGAITVVLTLRVEEPGGAGGPLIEAIKAKTDLITSQTANQQQTPARTIRIIRGDSYAGADAITIPLDDDFTGWTATFTVRHRVTDVVICQSTTIAVGATSAVVTLTTTQTAFALLTTDQDFGPHPYDVQLVSGTNQRTFTGVAVVRRDRTRE